MSHPKYADMIIAAVKALGGKGASRQAIDKYVVKEFNLIENKHHHSMLNQALKRLSVPKGALVHSKGKGAAGSFKLRAAVPESKSSSAKPKQAANKKAVKKSPKKSKAPAKPKTPKETKTESKQEAVEAAPPKPKPPKAKKSKKSKAASPKKPKAVKVKKTTKKATAKKVPSKK